LTAKPRAAKPPPEVTAIISPPDKDGVQLLVVSVGKETDGYHAAPLASDFGPSFRLVKLTGKKKEGEGQYDVSLHGTGQCCCKGFSFRGTCRHTKSLYALWARGELNTASHAAAILRKIQGE
jgi:hypothetical protein